MRRSELREWLGASAVLLGLVFVGYELRQNTIAQRITATQTLAAEYVDAVEPLAYEGELACVYVLGINGLSNLSDDERLRFFVTMFQIFRAAEQLHHYADEGVVEPRIWRGFERQVIEIVSLPGVQEWWTIRRSWFSDRFQAFTDANIAAGPAVEPQTYADHECFDRGIGVPR